MIRAILGTLGLGMTLFVGQAYAQALPSAPVVYPVTSTGNVATVGNAAVRAANSSSYAYNVAANGSVYGSNPASVKVPGGSYIPVTVKGSVGKAAVAAAVGRFFGKIVGPLAVGMAVYDLAKELGFNIDNSGGSPVVSKIDPAVCTVAPCYGYRATDFYSGSSSTTISSSPSSAATLSVSTCNGWSSSYRCSLGSISNTSFQVVFHLKSDNSYSHTQTEGIASVSVAPSPVQSVPSSLPELNQAISDKNDWPATSALGRVVKQSVDAGEDVYPSPVEITGPASSPGSQPTVTTDPIGKTQTTTTTKNDYQYSPNSVTTKQTQESKTVNTETGATTAQTTTESNPDSPKQDDPPDIATDTPLGALPKLYERKYKDGLTGVWNTKKAELMATPLLRLTSNLQPAIGSSGGYPVWPVPVVIGHWNFGTYDVSPASYVWDFLKVCTILGALFLARALIFGG